MIKIENVYGDVIEAGGTKTVNNTYYGVEPTHTPVNDIIIPTEMVEKEEEGELPKELSTPEAQRIFRVLIKGKVLSEDFQPIKLTNAKLGCIVELFASRIVLGRGKWGIFAKLWDMKPDSLRSAFNQGQYSKPTIEFNKKILSLFA